MPKTITITCEICNADITNSSRCEASYISELSALTKTLYFCGYMHLYDYFHEAIQKKSE